MSKCSRRPGRAAIKEQRRARQRAQRALRQQQQAQGLSVPPSPSLPNQKCPYQTEAEERTARLEVVTGHRQAYGSMLPGLLKRLSQIPDPRQPHSPAEPEIRNSKLEIRNKSELPGMGQWGNGKPRRFFAGCEQSRLEQCIKAIGFALLVPFRGCFN